jgi:tRNA (cmo5U34)-methyltransferase
MSLVIRQKDGQPVHYPKRRDIFEFDEEVSAIFENMAQRSIPMYSEVHRLNAAFIERHKNSTRHSGPYVVWDIGGSTGMAMKALADRMGMYAPGGIVETACHVIDVSQPMLDRVHKALPWVVPHNIDITQDGWADTPGLPQPDCIIMNYVLQFVKPPYKAGIVKTAANALRPRGLFLLAQKETIKENNSGIIPVSMDAEYIQFRKDNGYTQEEIDVKTAALKNSMWLVTKQTTLTTLYEAGFQTVYETSRWCQFASYGCTKTKSRG